MTKNLYVASYSDKVVRQMGIWGMDGVHAFRLNLGKYSESKSSIDTEQVSINLQDLSWSNRCIHVEPTKTLRMSFCEDVQSVLMHVDNKCDVTVDITEDGTSIEQHNYSFLHQNDDENIDAILAFKSFRISAINVTSKQAFNVDDIYIYCSTNRSIEYNHIYALNNVDSSHNMIDVNSKKISNVGPTGTVATQVRVEVPKPVVRSNPPGGLNLFPESPKDVKSDLNKTFHNVFQCQTKSKYPASSIIIGKHWHAQQSNNHTIFRIDSKTDDYGIPLSGRTNSRLFCDGGVFYENIGGRDERGNFYIAPQHPLMIRLHSGAEGILWSSTQMIHCSNVHQVVLTITMRDIAGHVIDEKVVQQNQTCIYNTQKGSGILKYIEISSKIPVKLNDFSYIVDAKRIDSLTDDEDANAYAEPAKFDMLMYQPEKAAVGHIQCLECKLNYPDTIPLNCQCTSHFCYSCAESKPLCGLCKTPSRWRLTHKKIEKSP